MNTQRRRETIEMPTGVGKVFKNNIQVATVAYSLRVVQEKLISKTFDEQNESDGMPEITGNISGIDGERDLFGETGLTLHLEDGRKLEFFVENSNVGSGDARVISTGNKGLFR